MAPNLAQVLNTLAHEIRTPLAVSQGYLKLFLDGRLTNVEDTRRAMEQTRQALGALATYCVDMGKISALVESTHAAPGTTSSSDFLAMLASHEEVKNAEWRNDTSAARAIATSNASDLAQAVAIVIKAAFDEDRDAPHVVKTINGEDLTILAGSSDAVVSLHAGSAAPDARAVDFAKGGKGLKLIWAAFVLDRHGVDTWTGEHRASVGIRIPLVEA